MGISSFGLCVGIVSTMITFFPFVINGVKLNLNDDAKICQGNLSYKNLDAEVQAFYAKDGVWTLNAVLIGLLAVPLCVFVGMICGMILMLVCTCLNTCCASRVQDDDKYDDAFSPYDEVRKIETKGEFDALLADSGDKLVVVDFTATWCPPCQSIKPMYQEWATKVADHATLVTVDVDVNTETKEAFEIE